MFIKRTHMFEYPEGGGEGVFQVGGDVIDERLSTGDHGHPGGQIAHHVMGGNAHVRFLRVESKVLSDDLLACGHSNLDRAVHHGVDELLHGSLDSLPHALLQLGMGLQQRDLFGRIQHRLKKNGSKRQIFIKG